MLDNNQLHGPIRLQREPRFNKMVGTSMVDPDLIDELVVVSNVFWHMDPKEPALDEMLSTDLPEIAKLWPDKQVVLYGWDPDPKIHPRVRAMVAEGTVLRLQQPEGYRDPLEAMRPFFRKFLDQIRIVKSKPH